MGYYSTGSTAIKASHSLYNTCAQQMELNKDFYIKGKYSGCLTGACIGRSTQSAA